MTRSHKPRAKTLRLLLTASLLPLWLGGCASLGFHAPSPDSAERWPKVADSGLADSATETRIDALMKDMTVEEKVGQIIQADIAFVTPEDLKTYPLGSILAGGNSAPGGNERASAQAWLDLADAYWRANAARPTRAHIPLLFGIDAVHGHSNLVGAVIFPHNIGLGAARDPELMEEIGRVTAEEMSLVGVDWTFAPTVAVPQDDRWGRTYEGFGEDPEIVASYSGKIVEGLQGKDAGRNGIAPNHIMSTAKHFLGDGGTTNGKDQGDTKVPEKTLVRIHNAGYPPALEAGALSVMASFSSWNGEKISGSHYLLTDVLKGRMGFKGFVVSDWNAHAQVSGCSATDCPQALIAGIDMYMAPDSWKGLYHTLLAQVKSGDVPMSRLDDAVRRIIRAKIKGGLFERLAPKDRPEAGRWANLGSAEHRTIARRAVRQSLVLIKNNGQTLPIKGTAHVLVTGDGADNIGKQSGGWTITWQGTGNANSDFPNGQSLYGGIAEAVEAQGGTTELSADGRYNQKPDVAVVVIGEDPYAEFQGDRPDLNYQSDTKSDLKLIQSLKAQGIKVVTIFLSGRPLYTNPEINESDAFVAAFLPGSEGGGVADVIIGDAIGKPRFDFQGKLPYSWPKRPDQGPLNVGQNSYDPQFAYGYGLSYSAPKTLKRLPETRVSSDGMANTDHYFTAGQFKAPWHLVLIDKAGKATFNEDGQSPAGSANLSRVDTIAQESGRRLVTSAWSEVRVQGTEVDLSRQSAGDMVIRLRYRLNAPLQGPLSLGLSDATHKVHGNIGPILSQAKVGQWATMNIRLSCFGALGLDLNHIQSPFSLTSEAPYDLSFDLIELAPNDQGNATCPI